MSTNIHCSKAVCLRLTKMAASLLILISEVYLSSCSSPAASLRRLHQGLEEELAPGQHGADILPPQKACPRTPENRLSRMPSGGAWKPSGKSTALAPVPPGRR